MNEETLVAVYDTEAHATVAVRDLETAGVPSSAITQHRKDGGATGSTTTTATPPRAQGFWSNLFGGEPEHQHDTSVYDRSMESGSSVVTVKASQQHVSQVMDILERHHPIDIDERAAGYGDSQGTTTTRTTTAMPTGRAATRAMPAGTAGNTPVATGTHAGSAAADQTVRLAEENLAVGKRAVNRGTTRIRRYVVETPVEEQVSLRDEKVSVERRPVSGNRPVTNPDFTDKVVEMTETDEEAVVSKTARVTEEVTIHKDATERAETVRDTLRHDEVEITKEPGVERTAASTGTTAKPAVPTNPKV